MISMNCLTLSLFIHIYLIWPIPAMYILNCPLIYKLSHPYIPHIHIYMNEHISIKRKRIYLKTTNLALYSEFAHTDDLCWFKPPFASITIKPLDSCRPKNAEEFLKPILHDIVMRIQKPGIVRSQQKVMYFNWKSISS